MNIWTAFFLVLSVVILASPLLFFKGTMTRNGSAYIDNKDETPPIPECGELELDLASGRITQEDYEAMTAKAKPLACLAEGVEGNDGSLPEG